MYAEAVDCNVELHLGVERDETLGDARGIGILDQRLAPLVLFDLGDVLEQRFEIAVLHDQFRGGFRPDARNAGDVVR